MEINPKRKNKKLHEEQDDGQTIKSNEISLENCEEPKIKYSNNDQKLGIIKRGKLLN